MNETKAPADKMIGASLIGNTRIFTNTSGVYCYWCTDGAPAAFRIDSDGWCDYACVKHTSKYFGYALPHDFRPVQYATVFRLCMVVTAGGQSITGGWESYPDFQALFKASREITRGGYFEEKHSGSNAHYRRTGHHRMVFGATERAPHLSRSRVVIHVVMK